jgi:hypothetical protein
MNFGRQIEYGLVSDGSRTATEQSPNKVVNLSDGCRVFCLPAVLAADRLPWSLAAEGVRSDSRSSNRGKFQPNDAGDYQSDADQTAGSRRFA